MTDQEHRNKLEEQAKGKKLTEEEIQSQIEAEKQKSVQGGSLWNHAGTFEERCETKWAKDRLKAVLSDLSGDGVTISGVTSINGDANIWMVRGKKRHGFAFEITLSWTFSSSSQAEVKGTLKIPNADVEDLDDVTLEPEVMPKTSGREADEAVALAAVRKLKPSVEKLLQRFLVEFKER